jgi:hypothetical protein
MSRQIAPVTTPAAERGRGFYALSLLFSVSSTRIAFPFKACVVCGEEFEIEGDKPGFANRNARTAVLPKPKQPAANYISRMKSVFTSTVVCLSP